MAISIGSQNANPQIASPSTYSVGPAPPSNFSNPYGLPTSFTSTPTETPSNLGTGYGLPTSSSSSGLPEGFTQDDLANLLASSGGDIGTAASALGMNPEEFMALLGGTSGLLNTSSGIGSGINSLFGLSSNPITGLGQIGQALGGSGNNTITGLENIGILGANVLGEIGNLQMEGTEAGVIGEGANLVNNYANLTPAQISGYMNQYYNALPTAPNQASTPLSYYEGQTGYDPAAVAAALNPANNAATLQQYETATGYNPATVAAALNPANAAGEISTFGQAVGLPGAQSSLEASLNPATAVQQMLSYEQPLSQNLTSGVTEATEANLAGSGLGLSPNIAQYAEAQALAPYQQNEQQMAQGMFGNQLNAEEANYQQALGLATGLYGQNVSNTLANQQNLFNAAESMTGTNIQDTLANQQNLFNTAASMYGQNQSLAAQEYLSNVGTANQDVYSTLGLPISALGAMPGFPAPAPFIPFITPSSSTTNTNNNYSGQGGGGTTFPVVTNPTTGIPTPPILTMPTGPTISPTFPPYPTGPAGTSTSTIYDASGNPIGGSGAAGIGTGMIPGTDIPINSVPPAYPGSSTGSDFIDFGLASAGTTSGESIVAGLETDGAVGTGLTSFADSGASGLDLTGAAGGDLSDSSSGLSGLLSSTGAGIAGGVALGAGIPLGILALMGINPFGQNESQGEANTLGGYASTAGNEFLGDITGLTSQIQQQDPTGGNVTDINAGSEYGTSQPFYTANPGDLTALQNYYQNALGIQGSEASSITSPSTFNASQFGSTANADTMQALMAMGMTQEQAQSILDEWAQNNPYGLAA
jgi:hypothetical protein